MPVKDKAKTKGVDVGEEVGTIMIGTQETEASHKKLKPGPARPPQYGQAQHRTQSAQAPQKDAEVLVSSSLK